MRVRDYLGHMLEAISLIGGYVEDMSEVDFLNDRKTQDAVIRNFEIIGEAANNIVRVDPEFAATHAEVPWADAYLLRNQISHGYFKVDLEIVWRTIFQDLPELKRQISSLLDASM
jgi:uncharacterized protein with HEPN domain